ncbi:glycosyl hydrolase [Penaeus vannamei]|uniref:Glycosyl hydrolase n=1 Tax=Penaeus vannamei TaxID=6689 RepID=A0A3R7N877_PENVA|nr:glycosyl hydrolase [Penaeus vannamei]
MTRLIQWPTSHHLQHQKKENEHHRNISRLIEPENLLRLVIAVARCEQRRRGFGVPMSQSPTSRMLPMHSRHRCRHSRCHKPPPACRTQPACSDAADTPLSQRASARRLTTRCPLSTSRRQSGPHAYNRLCTATSADIADDHQRRLRHLRQPHYATSHSTQPLRCHYRCLRRRLRRCHSRHNDIATDTVAVTGRASAAASRQLPQLDTSRCTSLTDTSPQPRTRRPTNPQPRFTSSHKPLLLPPPVHSRTKPAVTPLPPPLRHTAASTTPRRCRHSPLSDSRHKPTSLPTQPPHACHTAATTEPSLRPTTQPLSQPTTTDIAADTAAVTADTTDIAADTAAVTADNRHRRLPDTAAATADTTDIAADTAAVTADTTDIAADTAAAQPTHRHRCRHDTADTTDIAADTAAATAATSLPTQPLPQPTPTHTAAADIAADTAAVTDSDSCHSRQTDIAADTADTAAATADTNRTRRCRHSRCHSRPAAATRHTTDITADTAAHSRHSRCHSRLRRCTADTTDITADTAAVTAAPPPQHSRLRRCHSRHNRHHCRHSRCHSRRCHNRHR